MPDTQANSEPTVGRLADAERVDFGSLAHYAPLIGDGVNPMRTGIQTSEPGYVAPMHHHPYVEMLFIIDGRAEAWTEGREDQPIPLEAGDCIAMPAGIAHSFRTVGDQPMRLLGIHGNPERVVHYADGQETGQNGYQLNPD